MVKWLKWTGIIILSLMTGGAFLGLYLFWKYIKLCIKLDLFLAYLIIRIPIFFIQLFAYAFSKPAHGIVNIFHAGFIESEKAKYSTLFIGFIFVLIGFFLLPFNFSDLLSISAWTNNLVMLFLLLVGSAIPTLIINAGRIHFDRVELKDVDKAALGGAAGTVAAAPAAAQNTANMAGEMGNKALEAGEKAEGVYDKISAGEASVEAEEAGMYLGDLSEIVGGILGDIPGLAGMAGEGAAAEGAAASAAGGSGAAAVASNPVGWGLVIGVILLLIIALVGLIIQAIIFVWIFLGFVNGFMGYVGGPMMEAAGLGSAYAGWFGDSTSDRFAGTVSNNAVLEDTSLALEKSAQKAKCAFKGPQCLRQWRLNNTERPDSQDVGETYGLKIDQFRLGSGERIDISRKPADFGIPLSYRISNTRHGLKGINANDVQYRIRVTDSNFGKEVPYCSTGWVDINGYDVDGDGEANDLHPGTSASTGFTKLTGEQNRVNSENTFTLENCRMLQPGAGETRRAFLDVKYDYFSQATLYLEAMSREYQNSQNIDIESKNSETADTPVKAALSADNPVIFDQENPAADQPVSLGATLQTEDPDIEYRVKDLELRKSRKTEKGDGICSFTEKQDGSENTYSLDENSAERLIHESMKDADYANTWFSKDNPPSIFGCQFDLDDNYNFNPSGETLTKEIETNYTVKTQRLLSSFTVINTQCRRYDCPMVYYLEDIQPEVILANKEAVRKDAVKSENFWKKQMATCDGPDAYDGCTAVDKYYMNLNEAVQKGTKVGSGEIAVEISEDTDEEYLSCNVRSGDSSAPMPSVTGFQAQRLKKVVQSGRNRVIDYQNGKWSVESGEEQCGSQEQQQQEQDSGTADNNDLKTGSTIGTAP